MPRETPATPGRVDAERPFNERRDVLFKRIEQEEELWDEKKLIAAVGRVFEHSVEDGMRLAERLAFTPGQYRDAIDVHNISFALKHPKVFSALSKKVKRALNEKHQDMDFDMLETKLHSTSMAFASEETTSAYLHYDYLNDLRGEQKLKQDATLRAIDDLYLDALTKRHPKLKVHEREGTDRRSKGEVLAGRYLNATENILEKRFYTGPVKDMFPALARDPLFHHPTVLESDLLTVLKNSRIQADAALTQLEPARVVAYSQLDTIKRGIAERELVKELKDELPEGKTVALDREEGVYQIEDEPGADKTRETSEPKSEAERMAEFEERVMDEMERLTGLGADPRWIAKSLAGLDSERAWKLRKSPLMETVGVDFIFESMAGVDSKTAWNMRRELSKKSNTYIILFSLAGCESHDAWVEREKFIRHVPEEVCFSLIGLDSELAWEMRDRLIKKPNNYQNLLYSLSGLDSERAWKMRERLVPGMVAGQVLPTLVGLDSKEAWKMRNDMQKSSYIEDDIKSIAGLDSPLAWEWRWKCLEDGVALVEVAESLVGLDSKQAWDMRKRLEQSHPDAVAKGIVGDRFTFVWRLNPEMRAKIGMKGEVVEKKRELTTKERLAEYEKKTLAILEQLEIKGVGYEFICAALVGFDSDTAWTIRNIALMRGERLSTVVSGLAGVDSKTAWDLRQRLLDEGDGPGSTNRDLEAIGESLAGLDSEPAWRMRHDLLKYGASFEAIATSLIGLDSKKAWDMRRVIRRNGASLHHVIISITGVASSEAWKLRHELLQDESTQKESDEEDNDLAVSVAGLDSSGARELRERLLAEYEGFDPGIENYVLPGLAGVDSAWAWELREEYIKKYSVDMVLVESLVGLDSPRAWKLRQEAVQGKDADLDSIAVSINGNSQTFVWRLRKEPFGKSEEVTGPWQEKLRLLNLVHDPTLEGIRDYHTAHPPLPPQAGLSQRQADVLSELFSDRSAARALLATNAAVPDRAPERLADALFRRMAPGSVREPSPSFGSRLTSAFNAFGSDGRPPLTSAVAENPSYQLFGGGSENLSDTRTVLEAREATDELLVQGIYGRYDVQKKTWEKIFFPVRRDISGPTKETTLTLTDVAGAGRVSLPLSLDARLIAERVKGVTSGGKEIALEVSLDSLGQASVQVPPGVTRILYSVEQPLAPEPLHDPSPKEFESYLRTFQREHGKDMTAPLARLPHDVEAEVKSRVFQALSPKQKMIRVEALVREVGWYDTRNDEVSQEKLGKTPEEHIAITEERLEVLKTREKPAAMAGKKFAGVCADFSLITATLLRKAGLPAGIMSGLHLTGKTAQMRDMHATAFVPWPDGRGGIRLVAVDGTPSSGAEAAAGIARPSLADLEDGAEQATDAYVAESKEVIDALLRSAGAHDIESIRNLKNSKLENALNIILRYEVKQPHLRVVEGLLNAYWYGGLAGKKDRLAQNIQLRGLLEAEVARARSEPAGSEEPEPAGTRLLQTTRDFLSKFQRGGAATSTGEAFDLVERVAELAKGELSDVEHRALIAVITYLRAEKMR